MNGERYTTTPQVEKAAQFKLGQYVLVRNTTGGTAIAEVREARTHELTVRLIQEDAKGILQEFDIAATSAERLTNDSVAKVFVKGQRVSIPRSGGEGSAVVSIAQVELLEGGAGMIVSWIEDGKPASKKVSLSDVKKVSPVAPITPVQATPLSNAFKGAEMGDDSLAGFVDLTTVTPEQLNPNKHEKDFLTPVTPETPDQLSKLKYFIDNPLQSEQARKDFVNGVLNSSLGTALLEAGYLLEEIDSLIKKSLGKIEFAQDPAKVADDINRIINNFYIQAQKFTTPNKNSVKGGRVVAELSSMASDGVRMPSEIEPAAMNSADIINNAEIPLQPKPSEMLVLTPQLRVNVVSADQPVAEISPFAKKSDIYSISNAENIIEESDNLSTEFDARASEYAEYGNRQLKPARLVPEFKSVRNLSNGEVQLTATETLPSRITLNPESLTGITNNVENTATNVLSTESVVSGPLVLTPDQRISVTQENGNFVGEANQEAVTKPDVPVELSATLEAETQNLKTGNDFRDKLETIISSESFSSLEYIDYVTELQTTVKSRYEQVLLSAKNNLQRFSETYTPGEKEKEALQLLSNIRARYIPMQSAGSETGVLQAELLNSLNRVDTHINEADVKKFTQRYSETMIKVLLNISKLESLIIDSKVEKKPPVSETYRNQLETLRVSGNRVLATLPSEHELYIPFKDLVESQLTTLMKNMKVEDGGDRYFIENSSAIMVLRNKIKAAIEYLKTEQEYSEFKSRAEKTLDTLKTTFEACSDNSDEVKHKKQEIADKVREIYNQLHTSIDLGSGTVLAFAVADSVTTATNGISELKSKVKTQLQEVEELVNSLPKNKVIESDVDVSRPKKPEIVKIIDVANALHRTSHESLSNRERVNKLLSFFVTSKIGKAAVLAAAIALPSPTNNNTEAFSTSGMAEGQFNGSITLANGSSDLNTQAIKDYLSSVMLSNKKSVEPAHIFDQQPSSPTLVTESLQKQGADSPEIGVIISEIDGQTAFDNTVIPIQRQEGDARPFIEDAPLPQSQENIVTADIMYEIKDKNDIFWNIVGGKTEAGLLPVMNEINPKLWDAVIDLTRDELNNNPESLKLIGGFDGTKDFPADHLEIGGSVNLTELEKLIEDIAKKSGYL